MVETIKNLVTNSLKQQQPIQSQSFTCDSDENNYILNASPVNYKDINLDNTNMNTSTMNDGLRDESTDIVPKKRNHNSILEHLEEVKKKIKNDYYAFKFSKNDKTSEEICKTTTIQLPILERNPCRLILHVGTNNAKSCSSRETLDKLLKLKSFISEKCPQCQTIFSAPTIWLDKAKANLTVSQLANYLLQLKMMWWTIETLQTVALVEKGFI